MTQDASFQVEIQHSSKHLARLDVPQVHHLLLDIQPGEQMPEVRLPVNLAIVIDCSTSMSGPRLDAVRSAVLAILKDMKPEDRASVVAFSDRAEVIISPDQAKEFSGVRARLSMIQAEGGTDIGQGLTAGMEEIRRNYPRDGANLTLLLTDGFTYGDEPLCVEIANQAAEQGIMISSVGIGTVRNDWLLNQFASITGGRVAHLEIGGDIPGRESNTLSESVEINLPITFEVDPDPLPNDITSALDVISLFRTQEKVRREAGLGQVGQGANLEVDVFSMPAPKGGYLLICSDGLWGVVPDPTMMDIIRSAPNPKTAYDQLVQAANFAGGPDNNFFVLVQFPED